MNDTSTPSARAPLAVIPPEIACARDYASLAQQFMAPAHFEYVAGGSGAGRAAAANLAAFDRWSVYPRLLRDVRRGHSRITFGGQTYAHPILLAPVAFQKLAHPAGELESARAAHATDTCVVTSTLSSCTMEEVARAAGPQRWFQLYFQPQREHTRELVERAARAGYGAIVVTLDAAIQAASQRALRAGFRMPPGCVAANLRGTTNPARVAPGESLIFQGLMASAPRMDDLAWLIGAASLPVWVKGVLHQDDARALQAIGVAGVIVSNHGGRGLEEAPASLDALAAVRAAVGPGYPVLLDSGIRSGSDIFKALALGADAVLVGRLQMYALAVAGALGVAHMVRLLCEELELCMALAGCASVDEIGRDALAVRPRHNNNNRDFDADHH